MGDRRERPTKRLEDRVVSDETAAAVPVQAEAAAPPVDDDPLADWDEVQPVGVAAGSQSNALPTTSRTATLADPLTTQLLAEVARRTSTMEFDPDGAAIARDEEPRGRAKRDTQEMDPETLNAALRGAEKTPVPTATSNIKRRTK